MFYKLRNDILFRQYPEYGCLTDNTDYGYRFLNDPRPILGEIHITDSAAMMVSKLNKIPRCINDIIDELMVEFVDVNYEELKNDTIDFFDYLVDQGYLSSGNSYEECIDIIYTDSEDFNHCESQTIITENCAPDTIDSNDFLRHIHFDIASLCNERCVHCYIPHKNKISTIDTDLFYQIVEEGRKMNIIHVTLSGGEPLLHMDFINFLRKCRELDLSVNVLSNLTLLTDEMIIEMVKNPLLSVQTSLYSMVPEIHDSITKVEGSFVTTFNAIKKLLSNKIPVQISCPVMKQNKDSFVDVIRWGRDNNIGVAVEPVIFASYDPSENNLENRLTIDEVHEAIAKQIPEGFADVLNHNAQIKESQTGESPICSVCRYSFCVSVEGNVFPCAGWQTNVIGNLNDQTIYDVWTNSKKANELRNIKRSQFKKCVECKDRGYCTVCMMSNMNENSDSDPFYINEYHCKVAAMTHQLVDDYFKNN